MQEGRPSRTALATAAHRAAHQILEGGRIFTDPLALRILDADGEALVERAKADPADRRALRLFMAVRARFVEDMLASSAVGQLVILGAGLDTFAYRTPRADLRIFEVDFPATQAWKRRRLAEAGIAVPPTLTFAPVDFERQTLAEGLTAAGFDPRQPSFFSWLGVVPYLEEPAVLATLGFIAVLPGGAHVVFDYANPPGVLDAAARAAFTALANRVAAVGESFKTYFETDKLSATLKALGFKTVEDLGAAGIVKRYFSRDNHTMRDRGGHIMYAATV